MSRPDLRFDFRDLAAAALDSPRDTQSLCLYLLIGPIILHQFCFLPSEILPALNDDIDVFRIEFGTEADTLGRFCSDERRA